MEGEFIKRHHRLHPAKNQCTSFLHTRIKAPLDLVWSLVRRFDQPQRYKPFVRSCVVKGEVAVGSVREIDVKTGLPATTSTERLEQLDDNQHVLGVRILGGDHLLKNYSSIVTVHPDFIDGRPGTLVIESFVVDVPDDNTEDDIIYFVKVVIGFNHKYLTEISEGMAMYDIDPNQPVMAGRCWRFGLPYPSLVSG